jgi:hypothetical protein
MTNAAKKPARKQVIYLRRPSPNALDAAQEAAFGGRGDAHVRRGFARRADETLPTIENRPPLARMMSAGTPGEAGRGGGMRLKMYLTLHWLNSTQTTSDNAAQGYADLLDAGATIEHAGEVTDQGGVREVFTRNGKQRVSRAIRWLAENNFVELNDDLVGEDGRRLHRGRPATVTLLSDLGDGTKFTKPNPGKRGEPGYRQADLYFTIPIGLWTKGWISAISGPALMVLLIYLDNENRDLKMSYIAGSRLAQRYSTSETMLRRGSAELHAYGLATVNVRARPRFTSTKQSFTGYVLHRERFSQAVSPREDCPEEFRGYRIHDLRSQAHLHEA